MSTPAAALTAAQRAVYSAIVESGALRVDAAGLRALAKQTGFTVHELDAALDVLCLFRGMVAVGDDHRARLVEGRRG